MDVVVKFLRHFLHHHEDGSIWKPLVFGNLLVLAMAIMVCLVNAFGSYGLALGFNIATLFLSVILALLLSGFGMIYLVTAPIILVTALSAGFFADQLKSVGRVMQGGQIIERILPSQADQYPTAVGYIFSRARVNEKTWGEYSHTVRMRTGMGYKGQGSLPTLHQSSLLLRRPMNPFSLGHIWKNAINTTTLR